MVTVVGRASKSFRGVLRRMSKFVAQRDVPRKLGQQQIDEEIPLSWQKDNALWGYVGKKYGLKGSGAGFVTSPYSQYWGTRLSLKKQA